MSHYLVTQVEATPNIDVRLETEVVGGGAAEDGWLESLTLRSRADGATETVEELFLMIGVSPNRRRSSRALRCRAAPAQLAPVPGGFGWFQPPTKSADER